MRLGCASKRGGPRANKLVQPVPVVPEHSQLAVTSRYHPASLVRGGNGEVMGFILSKTNGGCLQVEKVRCWTPGEPNPRLLPLRKRRTLPHDNRFFLYRI